MPKTKPTFRRCRRRHAMVGANVRIEKRYYTPKLPAGKKKAKPTVREVEVCVKCIDARAAARKAGILLDDLRFGER